MNAPFKLFALQATEKVLTILIHAHVQALLETTRLALISVRFVHYTRASSGLTSEIAEQIQSSLASMQFLPISAVRTVI